MSEPLVFVEQEKEVTTQASQAAIGSVAETGD